MKNNTKECIENEIAYLFGIDKSVKVLEVDVDMPVDGLMTVKIMMAPTFEDMMKVLGVFEKYSNLTGVAKKEGRE